MEESSKPAALTDGVVLTPAEVESILPHRGRALHITEATTIHPQDKRGWSRRCIRVDDCEGHFPGNPVFPGKEIPEIIAQLLGVTAAVCYQTRGIGYLASIGSCKFRGMASPGERLLVSATIANDSRTRILGRGEVRTEDGRLIARVDDILIVCREDA